MEIKIIAVGKIKEKFLQAAIDEYIKRINPFCNLRLIEAKEFHFQEINKNIELEGKSILSYINANDYVISLEIEGNIIDSVALSNKIKNHYVYSNKNICFIIGGSNGLSRQIKARSDYCLSLGKMTFPHQLARLILCEQIYRAFAIINNLKYHK